LIQIKKSTAAINAEAASADAAALGALVKFGPRKRQVIRLVEAIAGPVIVAIERGKPAGTSQPSTDVRSILVVEYWNLGDIVMESPFLMNLRIQYPKARITMLTSPKVAPLIAKQQLVDEIVEVQVPWAQHYSRWRKYNPFSPLWGRLHRTLRTLRTRHFDLAFSARADLRDNFTLWFVNARQRVGYAFGGGGMFLTDRVVPDLRNPHFSNRWNRLLEHLGKPVLQRQPRLRPATQEVQDAKKLLQEHGMRSEDLLIAVHPGARSVNRQWGEENFREVAKRLLAKFPVKIIWFQEPGQQAVAPEGSQVIKLSLPLPQFMAVLSQCALFICNDSGPMHISTALDVPVVAVFGPTEPAWFGPLGANHKIVIRSGFWCRPCFDYCIFDQPYCLRTIDVQDVYQPAENTVTGLLAKRSVELRSEMRKEVPSAQNA
jgi:heptosyltransferase-2